MVKRILVFIIALITAQTAFASSVFSKKEETVVDKTQPFFINIYEKNDYDVNGDFDEDTLVITPQVHFFNKKLDDMTKEKEDNFFVTAKKSTDIDLYKSQVDTVELMSNYSSDRWDLTGGVYQEAVSGKNQYYNYITFEPSFKLNKSISIFGGMKHSLTDNHDQTSLGIKYTPIKFNRLEFKISVSNYTKQFYSYRNKLNFETIFKI